MKRTMMALTAFAAAAAFTTGFAANAQAAPTLGSTAASQALTSAAAPQATAADAADLATTAVCSAVAEEHRAVWAQPSATGATVGDVIAGRTYNADCTLVPGGAYTACGATTTQWAYINYAGDNWGYVPSTCLTWAS